MRFSKTWETPRGWRMSRASRFWFARSRLLAPTQTAPGECLAASDDCSRLFGRLGDAQTGFAKAAGIPTGVDLLNQAAGKESVFAWYDIGNLEFLYITRIPAAQAEQSRLYQARGSFERRHAGNADFYIRSSASGLGSGSSSGSSTVAFALVPAPSGDLLLLATREDLIANALQLIARSTPRESIKQEPWFHDASAAMAQEAPAPALHMVLNLDRIARDPHFRSYWIQRNITWTRQFRAAASDLYVEANRFREERVLLPKSPQAESAPAVNLASLASIAPPSTGFIRAAATRDPSEAISAIEEKLLGAYDAPPPDPEYAPDPDLAAPQTGSADDLEARIDTPPPVSASASTADLARLFDSAGLDAVLTLSSAHNPPEQDGLWVPIRSAVVLHTSRPMNPESLVDALRQTLRGSLTAANIGANFEPREQAGVAIYALTGPRPLFFAVSSTPAAGNLALLADDQAMLLELLHNLGSHSEEKTPAGATLIAVFNHSSQRAPYSRLTSLIDGTNTKPGDAQKAGVAALNPDAGARAQPAFFSQNIRSLSDTFANLQSERVLERSVDSHLRQTVTYTVTIGDRAF